MTGEKGKATMRRVGAEAGGGSAPGGGDVVVNLSPQLVAVLDPAASKALVDAFATFSELAARQAMRLEAALAHMADLYKKDRELHVSLTVPAQPSPIVNVAASPVPVRIEAIPPAVSFTHETGMGVRAVATLVAAELVAAAAIAVPLWAWYFQGKF